MAYNSLMDNCSDNINIAASISQYISDKVYETASETETIVSDKESEIEESLSLSKGAVTDSIKKRNIYRDIPSLSAKVNMTYINPGIAKMFK